MPGKSVENMMRTWWKSGKMPLGTIHMPQWQRRPPLWVPRRTSERDWIRVHCHPLSIVATSNTPRMIGDALCQIKKGIGHTSVSLRAQGHQTYPKMMCFHNTKSKFCSFDALLRVFQDLSSIVLWQGPFRPWSKVSIDVERQQLETRSTRTKKKLTMVNHS